MDIAELFVNPDGGDAQFADAGLHVIMVDYGREASMSTSERSYCIAMSWRRSLVKLKWAARLLQRPSACV